MSNVFYYEPFYDLDRLLGEAFGAGRRNQGDSQGTQVQRRSEPGDGAIRHFKPRMDLHEDNEKNLVTATFEFPGIQKEDVQIDVSNGRLVVSAESKVSEEHQEEGYAVRERRFGKYSRVLQLPNGLNEDKINASMENGVLTVTFPKSAPELAPKKIVVA